VSQNEQGWRLFPSRAQMIFPQLRQFGAGVKRGWMVALQGHVIFLVDLEGLVVRSRRDMADVRSDISSVVLSVDETLCGFRDGEAEDD
jgi:hypothetical protein